MLAGFVKVAEVADLRDGSMMPVTAGDEDVLLARIGEEYFAIGNRCTHFAACLSDGYLEAADREVQCPLHDSRFSLITGEPNCPPATDPVPTFAVKIVGDEIQVGPKQPSP